MKRDQRFGFYSLVFAFQTIVIFCYITTLKNVGHTWFCLCLYQIEKILCDGGRLTVFPNGTRKEVSADGLSIRVTFFNGDIKHIMPDHRVVRHIISAVLLNVCLFSCIAFENYKKLNRVNCARMVSESEQLSKRVNIRIVIL